MDSFVANELATLKSATELETEELLRERERMLDEAGEAARAHLEETRTRAESILAEARRDGEAMRARFEGELQADRERFEQALADREAQAQAQVAELLADAERRRREADELVSSANRVQTQVLASLEHARASLAPVAPAAPVVVEQPSYDEDVYPVELSGASGDAFSAGRPRGGPVRQHERCRSLMQKLPAFQLTSAAGERIAVDDLVVRGPVVLAAVEADGDGDPRAEMLTTWPSGSAGAAARGHVAGRLHARQRAGRAGRRDLAAGSDRRGVRRTRPHLPAHRPQPQARRPVRDRRRPAAAVRVHDRRTRRLDPRVVRAVAARPARRGAGGAPRPSTST